jgi:predicted dehydrogenase
MRIGLVGTGSFARRGPLPAIAMLDELTLEAVYDPLPQSASDAAEQYGARQVCDSLEALLALPGIDAVMVTSPPSTHLEVAGAVLEAGMPLICEKPVTLSSADAGKLLSMARAKGVPHAVDHEYRYDPAMLKMADLLREGAVGRVLMSSLNAVATFGNDPRFESIRYWNFHHCAALGGGMLPQFASHLLDLHLYFFGGFEPAGGYLPALVAERPTRPNMPDGPAGPMRPVEAEDSAALAARLLEGGSAAMSLTYVATAMPDLRWTIHGDEGALVYDGRDGWFGGTLRHARGWMGASSPIALPPRRREVEAPDINGWMQDLVGELLLDFRGVLGGERAQGRYATLADEVRVWRAIEQWRGASDWALSA